MYKQHRINPFLVFAVIVMAAVSAAVPQAAAAGSTSSSSSDILISCDTPGKIVEAGETVTFDLSVTNNDNTYNRALWYETYDAKGYDWDVRFMDGTSEINILAPGEGDTKKITVEVETNSETPTGKYGIRIHVGDGYYWLYVTISKTHTGEQGTLDLTVVDKDGEKIKGAVVTVSDAGGQADQVMSTADGSVSAQIDQGTYTVSVTKSGYSSVEKEDVKIKGGITTDLGTIMLDKALYAAEITVKSPVITTTASSNPTYDVTITNSGKSDDTYRLSVETGLDGWYFRFRESSGQSIDISELFLKSGDEMELTLEAIPPNEIENGDYNFTMVVDSAQDAYTRDLTAKIRGDYALSVYAEQYQYDVAKGEDLSFDLTLMNGGTAGALTNVEVSVTAPTGWTADIEPETIAGIQPGATETVTLHVVPPGNIVASEYKISVDVSSDQVDKSDDFRVVVHEQSYVGLIGLLMVLAIAAGVYVMFRKYNRR